jgi:hypothetical protein
VSFLLQRLGFTPQIPAHRAFERDEDAIAALGLNAKWNIGFLVAALGLGFAVTPTLRRRARPG